MTTDSSKKTLLVASSGARSPDELAADARKTPNNADLLEVRLDRFKQPHTINLQELRNAAGRPCMLTLRSTRDGGEFEGERSQRTELLSEAERAGFEWIDLERDDVATVPRGRARRLASWHGDLDQAEGGIHELLAHDADVFKVASPVSNAREALTLVHSAVASGQKTSKPVVAIPMGAPGRWLRPLAAHFNMPLLYAAIHENRKTGSGQLTVSQCLETYQVERIRPGTRIFAVAGSDVSHSLSPTVHNAVFKHLDVNAIYVDISNPDFSDIASVSSELDVDGLSVTAPFKQDALTFANEADNETRSIGAANTLIRREDGKYSAMNTDAPAFLSALAFAIENPAAMSDVCVGHSLSPLKELGIELSPGVLGKKIRSALIYGSGGAARAVAHALCQHGIRVTVTGRSKEGSVALSMTMGTGIEAISPGRAISRKFDLLIKAVPDRADGELVLDPFDFALSGYAADLVYQPLDTNFLHAARRARRTPIPGVLMFAEQAVLQAALFCQQDPREIRSVVADALSQKLL